MDSIGHSSHSDKNIILDRQSAHPSNMHGTSDAVCTTAPRRKIMKSKQNVEPNIRLCGIPSLAQSTLT